MNITPTSQTGGDKIGDSVTTFDLLVDNNVVAWENSCLLSQQTLGIHPLLFQCWASVFDAQH